MAKQKVKEQRYYNGIPVDSDEECYVIMWLEELIEHGYIERIERAESFTLADPLLNEYVQEQHLKTKTKQVEKKQKLLHGHIYTPEFKLYFTEKGASKFVDLLEDETKRELCKPFIGHYDCGQIVAYLEVKPDFDQNNMERLFKINQKWMMDKHGIFVNLVKHLQLFSDTFTPRKYMVKRNGQPRVIHIQIRAITDYLAA